jgi:hypothetical protein
MKMISQGVWAILLNKFTKVELRAASKQFYPKLPLGANKCDAIGLILAADCGCQATPAACSTPDCAPAAPAAFAASAAPAPQAYEGVLVDASVLKRSRRRLSKTWLKQGKRLYKKVLSRRIRAAVDRVAKDARTLPMGELRKQVAIEVGVSLEGGHARCFFEKRLQLHFPKKTRRQAKKKAKGRLVVYSRMPSSGNPLQEPSFVVRCFFVLNDISPSDLFPSTSSSHAACNTFVFRSIGSSSECDWRMSSHGSCVGCSLGLSLVVSLLRPAVKKHAWWKLARYCGTSADLGFLSASPIIG